MNELNYDLINLAKSVSETLHARSECGWSTEIEFDENFTSPKKQRTVLILNSPVASTEKIKSRHLNFGETKYNHKTIDSSVKRSKLLEKETIMSDIDDEIPSASSHSQKSDSLAGTHDFKNNKTSDIKTENNVACDESSVSNRPLALSHTGLKESVVKGVLSIEEVTEEHELWLIMTPQDYRFKKQHVDMDGRRELKGGQFEIQFFGKSLPKSNMVTLVSENNKLVTGPCFKGYVQISERLHTVEPVYHDSIIKENQIPDGLKRRYIPFGADIKSYSNDDANKSQTLSKSKRKKRKITEENDTVNDPTDSSVLKKARLQEEHTFENKVLVSAESKRSPTKKKLKKKKKKMSTVE